MNISVFPFNITIKAIDKIKQLVIKKKIQLKLRIYITGGGCGGFQYGFKLEKSINKDDIYIQQSGIEIIIDPISSQYLIGGKIDYQENLEGSKFIVINPNAQTTCGCGLSFSV
ncbi:Iron-sulfur cluster insertion protein ErpA [Buchnera aphidicola (Cinara kochiana kochiana)]|uniref:Iron-sulfur cluster insertion protein ErpA n=1 Tax=Buchnera aphidicola (Cinara kochiana kochiana) TaxID=2518976 RepID=A0A451D5F8_9GAMM|nr:iron-sulfur cluster insertion protein ErpA [Buchnera aphidicola]VFP81058.1 Iron-sulfur cluster insertion protein ErpA [Buchnera aphidicola (Cinara kochiana kochiana)]